MARPPTPVGAWGQIHTRAVGDRWEAHARIRMADGTSKQVRRRGRSKTAAQTALREHLASLADEAVSGSVSPQTRMSVLCHEWLDELEQGYALSGRTSGTPRLYRSYLRNWIIPTLGGLQAREVYPAACNRLIQRGRKQSYNTAKSLRVVLTGVCDYAVRNGAMQANPARSTARLSQGKRREVTAMSLEQRRDLIDRLDTLATDRQTDTLGRSLGSRSMVWEALPDIVRAMLSTGVRIGELLAIDGSDVNPTSVRVGHHLVRVPGQGLHRVANRKGNTEGLLLGVPDWSVPMWRERKLASGGGALFPSHRGGYMDPSNVINKIKEAMPLCGYEWVTSHVWRKTVATILDEANLPTTAIADQLGNTPAMVEGHYRRKRESNQQAREALDGML